MKCSHADGSAAYDCARAGHCRAPHFADVAQLVERTLGKGEVPSSILGISTMFKKPQHSDVLGFSFFGFVNNLKLTLVSEVCRFRS